MLCPIKYLRTIFLNISKNDIIRVPNLRSLCTEDKLFELMTKMYSDITVRLDSMDKKLDGKSDKSDIVRIENKLDNASKSVILCSVYM